MYGFAELKFLIRSILILLLCFEDFGVTFILSGMMRELWWRHSQELIFFESWRWSYIVLYRFSNLVCEFFLSLVMEIILINICSSWFFYDSLGAILCLEMSEKGYLYSVVVYDLVRVGSFVVFTSVGRYNNCIGCSAFVDFQSSVVAERCYFVYVCL